jgi:hypothetical protein
MTGEPTELRATDDLSARLCEAEGLSHLLVEALAGREQAIAPLFSNENLLAAMTVINHLIEEAQESARVLDGYRMERGD